MSSSTSFDIKSTESPENGSRTFSTSTATKIKIALGVVLAMAVIAAVGVCAAVLAPRASSGGPQRQGDASIDLETRAKLLNLNKEIVETHMASIQRREQRRRPQKGKACYSEYTNDSYPAAHIVGHGNMWGTTPEPSTPERPIETYEGYINNWLCDYDETHGGAFVDGGMNFTQNDRKLHVPQCGYYYVSSQIYFQVMNNSKNNSQYAYHQIVINRNCPEFGDNTFSLKSYSTLGPLYEDARFSTYIGDVVKMCEGGTIEVAISTNNPCCPYGTNSYIAAHLVAATSCDMRPKSLKVK